MEKVTIYYHKENDTLDVWFGNPEDEDICEEAGDGFILKKNKKGEIIGFEKLYVRKSMKITKSLPVEVTIL